MAFAIREVVVPGRPGLVGMASCPGAGGDLAGDVAIIAGWNASVVLTLVTLTELRALHATDLAEQLGHVGIDWRHAPIRDFDAPDAAFERLWRDLAPGLRALLADGRRLLLHCRYGVGRSGTIAARLLIETGTAPAEAIRLVRAAQPGAIETGGQEAFVLGLR